MSENKVQEVESVKALRIIQAAIKKLPKLNLVESPSTTGYSYFAGKKRLCKLLNTKRGIALEINVKLPESIAKIAGMESISKAVAHKKHLGTMVHMFRAADATAVPEILAAALEAFRVEVQAVKAAETPAASEAPATEKVVITKDQAGDVSAVLGETASA